MARRDTNPIPTGRGGRRPARGSIRRWRRAGPWTPLGAVIVLAAAGLIVLPALADGYLAVARPGSGADGGCRIYRVVDGDTVRMWCPRRGDTAARLAGFDAPELFSPACPSEFAAATRAKWALRLALLRAGDLRLVRDGTDRYGRALVSVFLDGEPLARAMIAAGHARAYAGGGRQGWCA